jgi:putative inorganic carbon (hco3(-)) transporter
MRLRLTLMLVLSPLLCLVALSKPFIGLQSLVVMYYFRPEVWLAPTWFRPQLWLTAAVGIGWLTQVRRIKFPALMKLAAFITFMGFVNALLFAGDSGTAMTAANVILKLVIVMLFTINLVDTPERMHWFLWANVWGMIYNLKAIILSGSGEDDRVDVGVGQGGGSNYNAMILTMTLPFLYMRVLNAKGRERIGAMFLSALYVMGVVRTGSRGGFLSLAAVVLYMLFKSNRKVIGAIVLALMMLLFAFMLPQSSLDRFKQGVGVEGERDESAQDRLKLWGAAIQMFNDSPMFGVGLDNYQQLSPRYIGKFAGSSHTEWAPGRKGRGFVTHSTWFQTLAEGGLVIAVPFFLMFFVAAFALMKVRGLPMGEPDRSRMREQALVLQGTFVAFIVSSSFGSHFKIDCMWWYFGAVAALKLIAEQKSREFLTSANAFRRPTSARPAIAGVGS